MWILKSWSFYLISSLIPQNNKDMLHQVILLSCVLLLSLDESYFAKVFTFRCTYFVSIGQSKLWMNLAASRYHYQVDWSHNKQLFSTRHKAWYILTQIANYYSLVKVCFNAGQWVTYIYWVLIKSCKYCVLMFPCLELRYVCVLQAKFSHNFIPVFSRMFFFLIRCYHIIIPSSLCWYQ